MKLLPPIKTPHGDIKLFEDDGKLFVSQGDLNEAMGYNRFLGTNARFPKILDATNSREHFGTAYRVDLKRLIAKAFPIFLDGYLSNTRQSSSRQQFFGKPVETIWRRTKCLIAILEETLMCYNPNSYLAKLGELGERIIRQRRQNEGYTLEIHPDSSAEGAHPIDLVLTKNGFTHCEEVKTRKLRPYFLDGITIEAFQLEYGTDKLRGFALNKRYAERNELRLTLTVISLDDKKIYSDDAIYLGKKKTIGGVEFPFYDTRNGYIYFHPKQFRNPRPLTEPERALFEHLSTFRELPPEAPQKKELTQKEITASFPVIPLNYIDSMTLYSEAANENVEFEVYSNNGGGIFLQFKQVVKALGYSGNFNLVDSCFVQTFLPFNPFVRIKNSRGIFVNAQILVDKALPCLSSAHCHRLSKKTINAQKIAPVLANKIREGLNKLDINLSDPTPDEKQLEKSEEQTMLFGNEKSNAGDYQVDIQEVSIVDRTKKSDADIVAQAAAILGVDTNDLIQFGLSKSEEHFRRNQSHLKNLAAGLND